jgi:RNA polymerase sigma-70 factor, ECF subfamily
MDTPATTMTFAMQEKETFVRLLEQHAGIVRKVAAGYSSSVADRHDLMQEITLQLWKSYSRYSPDRPFATWMYRVALNVAISFLRSNTRPIRSTVPLESVESDLAMDSSDRSEADERLSLLEEIIAGLEPLDRALLVLYLDEHSYREIAEILGISETNVATKLSRLKQRIRDEMLKLTRNNS